MCKMTSIVQQNYQIIEHLTKKTWGRGWVQFGGEHKMAEHSTRFRKHSKNSKKTTRRTASAIWKIFTELNDPLSPKHAQSKMNLDGGVHVLPYF